MGRRFFTPQGYRPTRIFIELLRHTASLFLYRFTEITSSKSSSKKIVEGG